MSRRMLGVSDRLHAELSELSKAKGVPMTVILETMLTRMDDVDWKQVKASYNEAKPTWKNIRRSIEEYRDKFPTASDQKLADLTGFSVAQVEVVTHSAHRRCLAILLENKKAKPDYIAKHAEVSQKFALRIWQQSHGVSKVPQQEQYLWKPGSVI